MKMGVRLSEREIAARDRRHAKWRADIAQRTEIIARHRAPLCTAHNCGRHVAQRGHIMCRDHWLSLPMPLRIAILEAHRARHRQVYQDAVREAVDLILTRETGQ
jgi:hypothetical protein